MTRHLSLRVVPISPLFLFVMACGPGRGAQGQGEATPPDDTTRAVRLLADAGVAADRAAVRRILQDAQETVVWIEPRIRGLPVFFREVGYSFDVEGKPELDQDGRIMVLGGPLPEEPTALDPEPAITPKRAEEVFLGEMRDGPEAVAAGTRLVTTLGLVDAPSAPRLALVWRVRPKDAGYPVVLVDARDGSVRHRDSGIRCVQAPCP